MKNLTILLSAALFFLLTKNLTAQQIREELLRKPWNAQWITGPGSHANEYTAAFDQTLKDYAVFKFRKTMTLEQKPSSFRVHVSADNRYKLFVNGQQVSQGPARGDLYFWNFETLDLAPYLTAGKNTVSAVVWNDGKYKPEAQISYLTAFILQGNSPDEEILNTNDTWKTIKDEGYKPLVPIVPGYYVTGPGEFVDMNKHVSGWSLQGFDDSRWDKARVIGHGVTKGAAINSLGWMLVPSPIPPMEMKKQRLQYTRKSEGASVPKNFPSAESKFTVSAHAKAVILLDQGFLTNAYPTVSFSAGRGASLVMGYSEGLYIRKGQDLDGKGNRNETEGKIFIGKTDSLISNGAANQEFTSLWWRTYRYLKLTIYTKDEPLTLNDIYGTFTGYPFENQSKLTTTRPELSKILDIGWRTARLCAFETYMDCPYYEQLQYIGDARIQALVSFYNAGDDRLAKSAITQMDRSRIAEGITLSRYPTALHQQIPTFSLWWIAMLHDCFMYRPDSAFIKDKLPGTRQVFSFFERCQRPDGSLKNVPYWIFTDWVNHKGWVFGMAPVGENGESATLDMQLLWTYQLAAEMEEKLGFKELARSYINKARQLKESIQRRYWRPDKGLYADTETGDFYSQHANSLAILSGVAEGDKAKSLAMKLEKDSALAPASIYFKYYLHQALAKAGLGDNYLNWLGIWRENINLGLTTWAETSDVSATRSDCHAWGSSPNIEVYRIILGIDSDAPGFAKIKITPHLGTIEDISGEMPHPNGKISVKYKQKKGVLSAEIYLPKNTDGKLVWKGKEQLLKAGSNVFKL